MESWTLWQYRDVFNTFYRDCDDDLRDAIDNRLDQLLEKGNQAREPVSIHLEDGILELRADSGDHRARFLYYFQPGKKIVVLVAAYKDQGNCLVR